MVVRIDCKGLACPQPVLRTKDLIEEHPQEIVEITVDNEAAKQNVSRFLESQGWNVSVKEAGEGVFVVTGAPNTCSFATGGSQDQPDAAQKIVVFLPSARLGEGSDELGSKLMANFITTLKEMDGLWRIILVNSGVTLASASSATSSLLKELEEGGVEILVCGTCLEYYGLMDKKAVGVTTNMLDIVTSMQLATKVIRI